jgi:regulator of protease activity HflC (stomatin/prohibitin superfamily)
VSTFAVIVLVLLVVGALAFVAWQVLNEARVRVESGTIGLVIARGATTERALEPGVHYIWPYRQQLVQRYPLREMTYLTLDDESMDPIDFADPPLALHFADRTAATVRYSIRFRIRKDDLSSIHDRLGPEGIRSAVRDRSRQAMIDTFASADLDYNDTFAERRIALQARLTDAVSAALLAEGFDVVLFTLRDVDLGPVGDMLQDASRRRAELEREEAAGAVRRARVRNDAAANAEIAEGLDDAVLRYRQIELLREAVDKWDGTGMLPSLSGGTAAVTPVEAADGDPSMEPPQT